MVATGFPPQSTTVVTVTHNDTTTYTTTYAGSYEDAKCEEEGQYDIEDREWELDRRFVPRKIGTPKSFHSNIRTQTRNNLPRKIRQ